MRRSSTNLAIRIRRRGELDLRWGLLILAALVVLLITRFWNFPRESELHDPAAEPRPVQPQGDLAADEKATIELFRQASRSVVYITTTAVRRNIFSLNAVEVPRGSGSGFIWDERGYIVTNYHVIQGAYTAKVTLADHSTHNARLVGEDPDHDLAVLKIDAGRTSLPAIEVGTSKDLLVGQKAFAIGNPFGLDQTLTTGVISGLNREIESVTQRPIKGVIQTDAAINPGNSGGPLLNSYGRLIGVNTAIYSPSGAYAGVGFAVPVDTVQRVVPQLIRSGRVVRPGLGIGILDDRTNTELGLGGVLVMSVPEGSSAEKAGLKPTLRGEDGDIVWGDVIVGVDDQPIEDSNDLYAALDAREVGEVVTLKVRRDNRTVNLKVTLEELPSRQSEQSR
jgi:S1-C subfamily serine protease